MLILLNLSAGNTRETKNNHPPSIPDDWNRNGKYGGQATLTNKVNGARNKANFDFTELVYPNNVWNKTNNHLSSTPNDWDRNGQYSAQTILTNTGASFEGAEGAVDHHPKGKRKKKKKKKKKKKEKREKKKKERRELWKMSNYKVLFFFQFFNSPVALRNKKNFVPKKKLKWRPWTDKVKGPREEANFDILELAYQINQGNNKMIKFLAPLVAEIEIVSIVVERPWLTRSSEHVTTEIYMILHLSTRTINGNWR